MHASLVPTATDLAGLVAYILGNPYLFISSSTVMTTGLVLGAVAVSMVPRSAPAIRIAAPPLAILLTYFGVGSMVLATEILLRFHASIPDPTETQFASGVGHLLAAGAGIAVLAPHLRARSRRTSALSCGGRLARISRANQGMTARTPRRAFRSTSAPRTKGARLSSRPARARPRA